jgi:hypothetical protein
MKVSVFGNPNIPEDSLPLKIATYLKLKLPSIEFIHQDPQEQILPPDESVWWIIDTVIGLKEVVVINNLDELKDKRRLTMHDYDVSTELKLIKKIKPDIEIKIIGVPPFGEVVQVAKQVVAILSS